MNSVQSEGLVAEKRPEQVPERAIRLVPSRFLLLLLILLFAVIAFRLYRVIPHHTGITHVAGVWATLAEDLSRGVLYRPLLGPLGYGGTRYMPLQFVLHAGLIRVTGEPLWSGALLTFLSFAGLAGAVVFWLRNLGVNPRWCLAGAALTLALAPVQLALTTIRGDLLAGALNLWGLAFTARLLFRRESARDARVVWPALFFTLAWLAKVTTLFGAAAAVTSLLLVPGRRRTGVRLLLFTALGIAASCGLLAWLSQGRIWESMRACASGGAINLHGIPFAVSRAFTLDPIGILPVALVAVASLQLPRRDLGSLGLLAFAFTLAVTLVIFLSPGADWNHLIDLDVCALVVFIGWMQQGKVPPAWGKTFLTTLALLALVRALAVGTVSNAPRDQAARGEAVRAARVLGASGPVLMENVGEAVEAFGCPCLLDPFALRLTRQRNREVDRDFLEKMDRRLFSGVILIKDPFSGEEGKDWYTNWHLGPGFREKLETGYRRDERFPSSYVFVPR